MAVAVVGGACSGGDRPPFDRAAGGGSTTVPAVSTTVPERPMGGVVRVGVPSEPDPALDTVVGAAVRSLTRPSLFVVRPDGSFEPSLVEDGSVTVAPGRRSVSFRLRGDARWSDGTAIGVEDLQRTADDRFVERVGGPASDGTVTVQLRHRIRGWQRLWSGGDAIDPPASGVWGGPFAVRERTPGLETVLVPNDSWWGPGPYLDEVRMVVVPDQTTMGELIDRGRLDVAMMMAATELDAMLAEVDDVEMDQAKGGGWWIGVVTNPDEVRRDHRLALLAAVERLSFVAVLLKGEAAVLDSFASPAGPLEGAAWHGRDAGDVGALAGRSETQLTGLDRFPMMSLLARSMQRRLRDASISLELRNAEAGQVATWLADGDFDAAIVAEVEFPWPCFTCRWGGVEAELARRADGGSAVAVRELEGRLRDEGLVLPVWRPWLRIVWRARVNGPEANGYGHSAAWNAWEWWVDESSG